jgi:hypothetical protein
VPIIPTMGNNDMLNHYKSPSEDQKELFYGDLYDIWFANTSESGVRNTFMQGGFYRVDLAEGVSVLSLNSILLNSKNSEKETASELLQRQWLEDQLSNTNDSSRFFLHMHIPPGQWWQTDQTDYWRDEILDSYLALFAKYQNRIIMLLSAHAHPGEVRAPVSVKQPNLELVIMMTPSISPLGLLQPGYTIIDVTPSTTKAVWRFLQLHNYILYRWPSFQTVDLENDY